jgi:hypothetical protein
MRTFPINTIGFYLVLVGMCVLVAISFGLSVFALTTHSTLTKILDVGNVLVNDVIISGDLKVSQDMNCKTQLVVKEQSAIIGTMTAQTARIARAITVDNQIMDATDAVLFVNATQLGTVSQASPISFTIPQNGSALAVKVPMNSYTNFTASGAFFQFANNATQGTSRLLALPTGMFGVSFTGAFTLSATPSKPVNMVVSLVGYDSQLIYANLSAVNSASAVLASATVPLLGSSSSVALSRSFAVPIPTSFTFVGLQILLEYSAVNNSNSPSLSFTSFVVNVYQNL